jgi:tetratricopeptide (TPR) repeat protein
MEDSTFPDPYVQKFLKSFEIGKINAEVDTITAAKYGIKSFPTTLVLRPTGIEIDRHVGYLPPTDFVAAIINSLSGIGTLDDLLNKLAAKPNDPDLIYEVGQKYRWRGEYEKAASYFIQTITLDPTNAKGLAGKSSFNLGHIKYKGKDYLGAIDQWRKLITAFPSDSSSTEAELMIPYTYQKANDFKKARAEFKRYLQKYTDTEEKEWIQEQLAKMGKK